MAEAARLIDTPMQAGVVERWIEAPDGWRVSVLDVPAERPRAIALVGHAMMVDRRTVYRSDRPSLATSLAAAGIRTLVPDLRGHGASGPGVAEGGRWSYEQLVADTKLYVELATSLRPDLPLFVVGNSLFGHTSLAYVGQHPGTRVAGFVAFAVNIWTRRFSADPLRGAAKQVLGKLSGAVVDRLGYLPVTRLKLGTQDEPGAYWACMSRWVPRDRWDSDDGVDYGELLGQVARPFLHIVSDGDRLLCHPDDALLFSQALAPYRQIVRLGDRCEQPSLRGITPAPGHVEMVSHPRCEPLWRHAASWMLDQCPAAGDQWP